MFALWALPPVILIVGALVIAVQLRRISVETSALGAVARDMEITRTELRRVTAGADEARAAMEELHRR